MESGTCSSGPIRKLQMCKIFLVISGEALEQLITPCGPSHGKQKIGDESMNLTLG